ILCHLMLDPKAPLLGIWRLVVRFKEIDVGRSCIHSSRKRWESSRIYWHRSPGKSHVDYLNAILRGCRSQHYCWRPPVKNSIAAPYNEVVRTERAPCESEPGSKLCVVGIHLAGIDPSGEQARIRIRYVR